MDPSVYILLYLLLNYTLLYYITTYFITIIILLCLTKAVIANIPSNKDEKTDN